MNEQLDDYNHQFSDLPPLVWNIARTEWKVADRKLRAFRSMCEIGFLIVIRFGDDQ